MSDSDCSVEDAFVEVKSKTNQPVAKQSGRRTTRSVRKETNESHQVLENIDEESSGVPRTKQRPVAPNRAADWITKKKVGAQISS